MKATFQIFERNNSLLIFTKGNILFVLMFLFAFLTDKFQSNIIIKILTIIFITMFFAFLLTKSLRIKALDGKFNGKLVFNENYLIINSKQIKISDIKRINFRIDDYQGYQKSLRFTQNLSNGTNNLVDIELNNEEKIKLFFKMDYQNQYEELKPFLLALADLNIITKHKVCELLKSN